MMFHRILRDAEHLSRLSMCRAVLNEPSVDGFVVRVGACRTSAELADVPSPAEG